MVAEIWVNIGSDNGLLPDDTKRLPWSILTSLLWFSPKSSFTVSIQPAILCNGFWNHNYTPASTKLKGVYIGFIMSVCPSVRPSIRLWVKSCPLCILNNSRKSLSYSYILSSNFRRCIVCKAVFKIQQFEILCKFFRFVILTLSYFDLGSNMNS